MAILKAKDIAKLSMKETEDKLKELKMELIKAKASGKKDGKSDSREIKRTIAKLLTFKRMNEIKSNGGKK
jgi:ribosomal protein L29